MSEKNKFAHDYSGVMRPGTRAVSTLVNTLKANVAKNPILVRNHGTEFRINLNESYAAFIEYRVELFMDKHVYNLVNTHLPDELQGQGLGTLFAQRILDHLVKNQQHFRLSCEFLRHVYKNLPSKANYEAYLVH